MSTVQPLEPQDPAAVGGVRLLGRLGAGGQGVVCLGETPAGDRVAVKLLRVHGDARARRYFAKELDAARKVDPFCTARILAADVESDVPYIVSEFIDGMTLREVVGGQGPRHGSALDRLAIGTATALTAIHQAGVVHRDFKPANVLLAPDGPRVIDFGVAHVTDATLSGHVSGTPSYMAPEQLRNEPPGPAADMFAWGATMAYAATGRPPFGDDHIGSVVNRILTAPPELGAFGGPLRDLVTACLSKDPAARPTARQALLRLLGHDEPAPFRESQDSWREPLRQGAGLAAPDRTRVAGTTTSFGGPVATRRRGPLIAVAAAAAAVVLAGAVTLFANWPSGAGASHRTTSPTPTAPVIPAGTRWFGSLGLVLRPGWTVATTEAGTHVLTDTCDKPQEGFFTSDCSGFWLMGPSQISSGANGFGSYRPGDMYYPASDVEPCPTYPEAYISSPKKPAISERRPVGGRVGSYTEYSVECTDMSADHKVISGYTEREWYLPERQTLVIDAFSTPELPDVLSKAVWRS